jgi:hypothetical protein
MTLPFDIANHFGDRDRRRPSLAASAVYVLAATTLGVGTGAVQKIKAELSV